MKLERDAACRARARAGSQRSIEAGRLTLVIEGDRQAGASKGRRDMRCSRLVRQWLIGAGSGHHDQQQGGPKRGLHKRLPLSMFARMRCIGRARPQRGNDATIFSANGAHLLIHAC
jgi:hypothetical protein